MGRQVCFEARFRKAAVGPGEQPVDRCLMGNRGRIGQPGLQSHSRWLSRSSRHSSERPSSAPSPVSGRPSAVSLMASRQQGMRELIRSRWIRCRLIGRRSLFRPAPPPSRRHLRAPTRSLGGRVAPPPPGRGPCRCRIGEGGREGCSPRPRRCRSPAGTAAPPRRDRGPCRCPARTDSRGCCSPARRRRRSPAGRAAPLPPGPGPCRCPPSGDSRGWCSPARHRRRSPAGRAAPPRPVRVHADALLVEKAKAGARTRVAAVAPLLIITRCKTAIC